MKKLMVLFFTLLYSNASVTSDNLATYSFKKNISEQGLTILKEAFEDQDISPSLYNIATDFTLKKQCVGAMLAKSTITIGSGYKNCALTISYIAIAKKWQNQGIGSSTLTHYLEQYNQRMKQLGFNYSIVTLTTDQKTQSFYQKLGFVYDGNSDDMVKITDLQASV